MTNEKAIKHLEVIKGDCALVGDIRALDMGISALSENNADKILNEFVEFLIKETCQGCKMCTPGVDAKGVVCLHQGEAVWYRDMVERFKEVNNV